MQTKFIFYRYSSTLLKIYVSQLEDEISSILIDIHFVSLTFHIWTSAISAEQQPYISLTSYYTQSIKKMYAQK